MLENIFYNNEFTYFEKKIHFEKKILLIGKGEILKKAYFFLKKIFEIEYLVTNENELFGEETKIIELMKLNNIQEIEKYNIILACKYEERAEFIQEIRTDKYICYSLTPFEIIMEELEKREEKINEYKVLDMFGGTGFYQTQYYYDKVKEIEIWEYDEKNINILREKFVEARVFQGDSYEKIKKCKEKFDMIVVDNFIEMFDKHCEHFDIFPDIFKVLKEKSILVLNVVPEASKEILEKRKNLFKENQLIERKKFYESEIGNNIPISKMIKKYSEIAKENGFYIKWAFAVQRSFLFNLVIKVEKIC